MEDTTESNTQNKKTEPEFTRKRDLSYQKCLQELCNPCDEWEDVLEAAKNEVLPNGSPKNSYRWLLEQSDDINIPEEECKHSYIFRRSHFYRTFDRKGSYLKKDLISFWGTKDYFVKVGKIDKGQNEGKWYLLLKWKN
jgi:hypothetical protein